MLIYNDCRIANLFIPANMRANATRLSTSPQACLSSLAQYLKVTTAVQFKHLITQSDILAPCPQIIRDFTTEGLIRVLAEAHGCCRVLLFFEEFRSFSGATGARYSNGSQESCVALFLAGFDGVSTKI
jgi:hypothetical protein